MGVNSETIIPRFQLHRCGACGSVCQGQRGPCVGCRVWALPGRLSDGGWLLVPPALSHRPVWDSSLVRVVVSLSDGRSRALELAASSFISFSDRKVWKKRRRAGPGQAAGNADVVDVDSAPFFEIMDNFKSICFYLRLFRCLQPHLSDNLSKMSWCNYFTRHCMLLYSGGINLSKQKEC